MKTKQEIIKQSFGKDFDFFKPFIDWERGTASVPSKIDRQNIDRKNFNIHVEGNACCVFTEVFIPKSIHGIINKILLTHIKKEDFIKMFGNGYSDKFIQEKIATFNSMHGFHLMIAYFGEFDCYEYAKKKGYDVDFKLSKMLNN